MSNRVINTVNTAVMLKIVAFTSLSSAMAEGYSDHHTSVHKHVCMCVTARSQM